MSLGVYPITIGGQRYVVLASAVIEIRRLIDAGSEMTALHTRLGRVPVCDLAVWADVQPATERRTALLFLLQGRLVGAVVDDVTDRVEVTELLDLPMLIYDSSVDPTVIGAVMIDDLPCLVLDLEAFALVHMPLAHTDF